MVLLRLFVIVTKSLGSIDARCLVRERVRAFHKLIKWRWRRLLLDTWRWVVATLVVLVGVLDIITG